MARIEKVYRRLPGRGMEALQHARLYRGPDHLLQVVSTGYSEIYKRFYFQDIQAIVIRKTHWGKFWTAIWAFFTALFGLPAFQLNGPWAIVMGSIAAFFGFFLIGNIVLGATCACFIRTAVQTERLSPVTRVRTARRLLKRLQPLIEPLQGTLSREELLLHLRGGASPVVETRTAPVVSSEPVMDLPPIISAENPPAA
jgi:hypothetical protein